MKINLLAKPRKKKYTIEVGIHFMETYGYKCGGCGYPIPANYGQTKAEIKFCHVTCPNCKQLIRNIEYDSDMAKEE
jgi:hypothetical protein